MLEKLFGRKIEEKEMDFKTALSIIEGLKAEGALPIEYRLKLVTMEVNKNPEYDYILETLRTFLAPYQYEHDPNLRGETNVRYIARDFPDKQTHILYFKQTFDNLFRKGLSGNRAELKIIKNKQIQTKFNRRLKTK